MLVFEGKLITRTAGWSSEEHTKDESGNVCACVLAIESEHEDEQLSLSVEIERATADKNSFSSSIFPNFSPLLACATRNEFNAHSARNARLHLCASLKNPLELKVARLLLSIARSILSNLLVFQTKVTIDGPPVHWFAHSLA